MQAQVISLDAGLGPAKVAVNPNEASAVPEVQQVVVIDARTHQPLASGTLKGNDMNSLQIMAGSQVHNPKMPNLPVQNGYQGQALQLHGKIISPADLPEAKPKYPERNMEYTPVVKNTFLEFDPPPRSPVRTVR